MRFYVETFNAIEVASLVTKTAKNIYRALQRAAAAIFTSYIQWRRQCPFILRDTIFFNAGELFEMIWRIEATDEKQMLIVVI